MQRYSKMNLYNRAGILRCLAMVTMVAAALLLFFNLRQLLPLTAYVRKSILTMEHPEDDFARVLSLTLRQRDSSMYSFNSTLRLPLLRLQSPAESNATWRCQEAAKWLRGSVDVVFAATVRNAMRGLPSTAVQMKRLAAQFRSASFVFVENDSTDGTRKFLDSWRRRDPRVRLLGCDRMAPGLPCRLNVTYSTGRSHRQGWSMQRTQTERQDRGVLMSAFRNMYLSYIYRHLTRSPESLLIVVDADLTFHLWNMDAILQGLYYFKDRPGLKSLCAHTRHIGFVYDACTLRFYPSQHFSQASESHIVSGFRTNAVTGLPPVKVDSCFQAVTAYRLSHLAQRQLMYGPVSGETVCEHNTLSRQLDENYLDLNMRLEIRAQNEGGY